MTLSALPATVPDLLRLVAIPVFAWAAVRDVETRRMPRDAWIPLSALAAVLLVWDGWAAYQAGGLAWTWSFLFPAAISLGFVVPLAYLFWWFGGFGGADAKALFVLALLFPTIPTYAVGPWTLPVSGGEGIVAFPLTVLTNAVLVGLAIPVVLAARNAAAGRISPVMAVGWPVRWDRIPETHGRLLQTTEGLALGGLDLDALRMYLRWRGLTLAELRAEPARYRDPATLPDEPNPPTDGAVEASGILPDGDGRTECEVAAADASGRSTSAAEDVGSDGLGDPDGEVDDPWGARAFLEDLDGTAYGTKPDQLRDGLEVLCRAETVWISPGTPFLVPLFLGLLVALTYGDLLVGLLF